MMPSDRNLSGRGGDGGAGGGRDRWGRPARGRGWAGRREVSEVFSWLPPPTAALINLPLSFPSEDGQNEGKGIREMKGVRMETQRGKKTTNKQRCW